MGENGYACLSVTFCDELRRLLPKNERSLLFDKKKRVSHFYTAKTSNTRVREPVFPITMLPFKSGHFPLDIVSDILSKLPLKSLIRFQSVSKTWLHLLTNPNFHYRLINHGPCRGCVHCDITLISTTFTLKRTLFRGQEMEMYFVPGVNKESDSKVAQEIVLPDLFHQKDFDIKTNACDGMICVATEDGKLVLWNPSIRDYKILHLPLTAKSVCNGVCGLGRDINTNNYKVVSVVDKQLYIFSLGRNSLKYVEIKDFPYTLFGKGIQANGCLYFSATKTSKSPDLVLCLNLSTNKYREVPFPPHENSFKRFKFSLLVMREAICLFYKNTSTLWMLEKEGGDYNVDEKEVIWTKLFTIPWKLKMPSLPTISMFPSDDVPYKISSLPYPICFTNTGKVVLSTSNSLAIYDLENTELREIRIVHTKRSMNSSAIMYTGSLISPSELDTLNDIN